MQRHTNSSQSADVKIGTCDKVMGPDQTAKFGPVLLTGGVPMAWRNLAKYGGSVTFFSFLFLRIATWPNPWTDFDA